MGDLSVGEKQGQKHLLAGYRQMAEDEQSEQEALDWCEALIADGVFTLEVETAIRREPNLK
jgi:ketopantoate hydroxymethyltransferase